MKKFYTYSTYTILRDKTTAPFTRGTGPKTYIYFSRKSGQINAARKQIPEYEDIVTTRVYRTGFGSYAYSPDEIAELFSLCRRCSLSHYRWSTVQHSGPSDAKIIIIGQSPGRTEDIKGLPFVGDSGKLLSDMMQKAGFTIPYLLTNIVACRPESGPGTAPRSDPRPEECVACSHRLWLLLQAVRPNVVLALGQIPAEMFWKNPKQKSMNTLHRLSEKLYVGHTRHPAYHLRKRAKGSVYEMEEAVEFFRKLEQFIPTLERYEKDEVWALNDDEFPFAYIEKELSSCE